MEHPTATIAQPDPPPPKPSGGDPTLSQFSNLSSQADTIASESTQSIRDILGQLKSNAQAAAAIPMPAPLNIPPRPQTAVDSMQALGNPMTLLAIFGSLLTRRPMVAALNAASQAMQGFAQGNREAYDRATQAWEDNLNIALRQQQDEWQRWKEKVDTIKDIPTLQAALSAEAAINHDQMAALQIKAGNLDALLQYKASMARQAEAVQAHQDMMQLRQDQFALASRREDDMEVTRAVQRDLGKEKMGLLHNKTADTVKAKSTELQSMSDDLQSSIDAITKDPTLGGAYGAGRRLIGETVGQVFPGAQDKAAADFATTIETLQARLTKPFLQAHYFTGNSAEEMETLIKGLNWRDDPTSTITSLQKVKDILDAQIGTISGAVSDVGSQSEKLADPWAGYSDQQLLDILNQPPGQ